MSRIKRRMGYTLQNILILFSMFTLQGCSSKPDTQQGATIAGLVFQEDQFFRLVEMGMQQAADSAGITLLLGNSNNRSDREIDLVNTYIARNVDAIIISPLSARASIAALQRASERKIKIVTYNTTIAENFPLSFIESDQVALGRSTGRAAAQFIQSHLGGRARVAILAFQSQAPEQSTMRVRGFKQEMAQLPGVEIVAEQDAWLAEQATKRAGDILTAHPETDIIWAANEGGTVGATLAVKNSGKRGRVFVFGTDASLQLTEFLLDEDNILQAITCQQPFEMGQLCVQTVLASLRGDPVEEKVSLPGVLLSRDRANEIQAFKARLQALVQ